MKRSSASPTTPVGHRMSVDHLRESIALAKEHATDHRMAARGEDADYHKDHAKVHEKAVKEDQKLLEKRQKEMEKSKK